MTTYGPYPGRIVGLHDGDTCHVDLSLGFGVQLNAFDLDDRPRWSARIYGINAPELAIKGKPNQLGLDALAYAQTLLKPGDRVIVLSHGWDAYSGRFDATITMSDGRDFAQAMIQAGHAIPYLP